MMSCSVEMPTRAVEAAPTVIVTGWLVRGELPIETDVELLLAPQPPPAAPRPEALLKPRLDIIGLGARAGAGAGIGAGAAGIGGFPKSWKPPIHPALGIDAWTCCAMRI